MAQSPAKNEHRRVPRILVNFRAVLIWNRKKYHCDARNLSEFGILLATPHKELVGTDVRLQLQLQPPNPALLVSGTVIYALPSGVGVRFTEISPEQRPILRSYLQAHGIGLLNPKPATDLP